MLAYWGKIREDRCRNVNSVLLRFQVTFTYILWTSIFTISIHYFYNQKHHWNKGKTILYVLVMNAWHQISLEVFLMRICLVLWTRRPTSAELMCVHRKKWQTYKNEWRYSQLEEMKMLGKKSYKGCLESETYLKISKYFRLRDAVLISCTHWHLLLLQFPHLLLHALTCTLGYLPSIQGFPVKMTHPSAESSFPAVSNQEWVTQISCFSFNLNGIRFRDVQLKDSEMGGSQERQWWGYQGSQLSYRNGKQDGESGSPEGNDLL